MFDTAIVGAGFGGLATALRLTELGLKVAVFETLAYGGGCASTFTRKGHLFEAGATLFSGFGEGELFARWIASHKMDVQFERLDPAVTLRTSRFKLAIASERSAFVRNLSAAPGARGFENKITRFFQEQHQVADALWGLFRDPKLLPPFGLKELFWHAKASPAYLPLIRLVGRSLDAMLERHGLLSCEPLRVFLDAVCQITVQCSSSEAEAPFALGAMDYYFRGTGHIKGGVGNLARAMVDAIRAGGSEVHLACAVKRVTQARAQSGFEIETRKGEFHARTLALNALPQAVGSLLALDARESSRMSDLSARVEDGWGAVMLYRVLDPQNMVTTDHAQHLELVADTSKPYSEGNHVFCSVSARDESDRVKAKGARTITMSTHVAMKKLLAIPESERGTTIAAIQDQMRATVDARAPELASSVTFEMPGSPRTFERFTGRAEGYVGGVPRRAGLSNYAQLMPTKLRRGVYLVGDTYFPGQSTLAVSLGGVKVAEAIARE
jgi:phytoene dehydrogenase-like protein